MQCHTCFSVPAGIYVLELKNHSPQPINIHKSGEQKVIEISNDSQIKCSDILCNRLYLYLPFLPDKFLYIAEPVI